MDTLKRIMKKIATSTSLLLVVMVLSASTLFACFYEQSPNYIQQYSKRVSIIKDALESPKKADVVLMGSSLMLLASYNSDLESYRNDQQLFKSGVYLITYLDSQYFQRKLEKTFHKAVTVRNLAFIASTPRDINLLVSGMINSKNKPKMIILGIAPRMMADNLTPESGAIGGELVLNLPAEKKRDSFEGRFANKLLSNPSILMMVRDYALLGDSPSFDQSMDFLVSKIWYFYRCRTELKKQISEKLEETLIKLYPPEKQPRRQSVSQLVSDKNASKHPNPEKFAKDLRHYNTCYNPPDFKKFEKNCRYFEQAALALKENYIQLVLVKMPLTKENRALLNPEFKSTYEKFIRKLTEEYKIKLLDFSEDFPLSDFDDSVHLNGKGSVAFFDKLAASLTPQ